MEDGLYLPILHSHVPDRDFPSFLNLKAYEWEGIIHVHPYIKNPYSCIHNIDDVLYYHMGILYAL